MTNVENKMNELKVGGWQAQNYESSYSSFPRGNVRLIRLQSAVIMMLHTYLLHLLSFLKCQEVL